MADMARIDQLNLSHVMKVMIIVCKPDLTGKLSEVWEGLYQIEQKLSDVNYRFQISDKAKGKLAHVNLLKKDTQPTRSTESLLQREIPT